MTDARGGRPPVAPKPSFVQQDGKTLKFSPRPSPALQGATTAFGPGPVKISSATSPHNASAGALLAAAAAANTKSSVTHPPLTTQLPSRRPHDPVEQPPPPPSTLRGRPLTTPKLPVSAAPHSSALASATAFQPHLPRSTSAVAAVAASAKTSPVRRPEARRVPTGSPASQAAGPPDVRHNGSSIGIDVDKKPSPHNSVAALAGALASVNTHPAPTPAQHAPVNGEKLGGSSMSHSLAPSSHSSALSSPSPSGMSAAATAVRSAHSDEARRRALSSPHHRSPGANPRRKDERPSPPNPAPVSAAARTSLSRTYTESEADRSKTARPPIAAPVPLRPSRGAIVAQENISRSANTNSPTVDTRSRMTASALADAMVAGSLASTYGGSRGGTPSHKPPPPVPRRRSRSAGVFESGKHKLHLRGFTGGTPHQHPSVKPLTTSRPMRHTLRNEPLAHEDPPVEHNKRGRRHWRRHPNMHHEGDRKRWRDKVTEGERRRYEGVWAANRGVLLDLDLYYPTPPAHKAGTQSSDLVLNVVVRDLWERSRLPRDVLEEVWDLVASPDAKALNREEFVVGLWLIDQRLKGRKLPVKVSPSVWSSVRHTQGVKISSNPIQK